MLHEFRASCHPEPKVKDLPNLEDSSPDLIGIRMTKC